MKCLEIPRGQPVTCLENDTIQKCALLMKERGIGFLPVLDVKSRIVGVITDRDIALRVVAEGKPFATEVKLVMTKDVVSVTPADELRVAETKLSVSKKSRIPIIDSEGRCLGVISLADIAQYESNKRAGEILREVTRRETKKDVALDLV